MPRVRLLLAAGLVSSLLLVPQVRADPAVPGTHVVQAGETLWQIAADAGLDVPTLMRLNALSEGDVLQIGQTLKLVAAAPAAPAAPAPAAKSYTVADGDTLSGIAAQLQVSTASLIDANRLEQPDRLVVGTKLTVPVGASGATAAPTRTDAGSYLVAEGDTLSSIAAQLRVSTAALIDANHVDNPNRLVSGAKLVVPVADAPSAAPAALTRPESYAVADGDTLSSIASRLGTSTAALIDANQLDDPNRLVIGTKLVMPGATAAVPTVQAEKPQTPKPTSKRTINVSYTVQPGETLGQIARQFEVRTDAVAQANGLNDPNRLKVGAVLKVPLPGYEHTVTAGETLRDIAAQEKVDLGSLIDFNELDDPELIRIGQVILVPAPSPSLQAAHVLATTAGPQIAAPAAPATTPVATPAAAAAPKPVQQATTPTAAPAAPAAPKPAAVVAPPAGAPTQGVAGTALKFLGAPYVWGGSSPSGFDCSGFVWYVARQAGKSIGRGMLGEYNSGAHPSRDELKPGDLVFFQNTYSPGLSHNGIFIGNGQFVHAADERSGVTISSLNAAYWSSHWFGATRLP